MRQWPVETDGLPSLHDETHDGFCEDALMPIVNILLRLSPAVLAISWSPKWNELERE